MDGPLTGKQLILILWGSIAIGLAGWGVVAYYKSMQVDYARDQQRPADFAREGRELDALLREEAKYGNVDAGNVVNLH